MEILDFQIFVQLAEKLHFGRTARTVGMSGSALTRRVQAMEDELGHQLVIRQHREIHLTSAGIRFRAFAQLQLDQFQELKDELREEASAPTGTLRIACTVTATHTVLPRLLATFRTRYPGVTLRLITQDASRSLHQLEAGEVDLAVIPRDEKSPEELATTILGRTELTFIGPKELSDWDEWLTEEPMRLNQVPLVAPISGLERKRLLDWYKAHKQEPLIVAEVRGNEGIIAMVSLGAGIGLVPSLVLESSPLRQNVRMLCSLPPPPGYHVSLCTRPTNLQRRIIQLFWQMTTESLGV